MFGFDDAIRRVRAFPGALDRARRDALVDAALIVERRTKENIQQGREEWPPLAKSTLRARGSRPGRDSQGRYARRGAEGSPKPLYAEGTMLRSIDHEVEDDKAAVGWTVSYGPVHEYGTTRAGRGHSTTIPARPHLIPAVEEGMDEMVEAFKERVARAVK